MGHPNTDRKAQELRERTICLATSWATNAHQGRISEQAPRHPGPAPWTPHCPQERPVDSKSGADMIPKLMKNMPLAASTCAADAAVVATARLWVSACLCRWYHDCQALEAGWAASEHAARGCCRMPCYDMFLAVNWSEAMSCLNA